ncbi:hypothetical protein [Cryobacterium tepidiphilum]|uniref:Uncharacterized protein n=1 Tax=Cryobacterium tepidiphilum TaxID=2486026 RepID=A0A3M8LGH9_9MICO|nr:hypothetical protein [Cryobacterium tepidiphilum]RNE63774.1 hypothetical protein EEJ31_05955 [Cryobacterium tepidiphilum]
MFMPVSASRPVAVAEVGTSTWEVREGSTVMGYIHRAGNVFVSLSGGNINLAVEVAQSLTLARALEALGVRQATAARVRLG